MNVYDMKTEAFVDCVRAHMEDGASLDDAIATTRAVAQDQMDSWQMDEGERMARRRLA